MKITLLILLFTFTLNANDHQWVREYITPVPDFPKKGVVFQWYGNLLKDPQAFQRTVKTFADHYRDSKPDVVVGLDATGFAIGAALAYELNVSFVMVRKPGKLPRKVERIDYRMEYASNTFEIEVDSIKPGEKVLIIDDVLATGGSAEAASLLVQKVGGEVIGFAFIIEVPFLKGRERLKLPVFSLVTKDYN